MTMNGKDGGWDLSDLEKEVDSVVETLLVEKGNRKNPATSSTPPQPSIEEPQREKTPTPPPSPAPTTKPISGDLREKLEEVEAQLLTLEWDINSKHINNAITHLHDLRRLSEGGDELEKVIILIQKVLHHLILDESKLTPAALKFLQKSWKAVKGMTDERFSFEIDKGILVRELLAEFQKLNLEGVPQEREERREAVQPSGEQVSRTGSGEMGRAAVEEGISFAELDKFMHKIENLLHIVNEEKKRWETIHREILTVKDDLQTTLSSGRKSHQGRGQEEVPGLDERLTRRSHPPPDFEVADTATAPRITVSLFRVSGVIFGLPEEYIIRTFPIKRWVSEFFMERGKVKLKNREIPLFNLVQVFKLKPSTEENPLVLLMRGKADRPAAVIVDEAMPREEIEYQPMEGRPYMFGQGITRSGKVWILDADQISP